MWKTLFLATLAITVARIAQAGDTLSGANPEAPELQATPTAEPQIEPRDAADAINPAVLETLDLDAASLELASRAWRMPALDPTPSQWKRFDRRDGTSLISVNRPLPLTWDTKVGADLNPAAATPIYDPATRPLPVISDRGTAAAWLSLAVPNLVAVEVRVNSEQDQNQLGASLSRSVLLGEQYSVTLENRFAVVEPLGAATPATLAPAKSVNTDRLVKLDIRSSGTTFALGTTSSTADNVTHSRLLAEQKIYGPFNLTTAVTDLGAPTAAKSISAGLRLSW